MQIKVIIEKKSHKLDAEEGKTILETLQGTWNPCADSAMRRQGKMRKCTVEVEHMGEVLACMTKVTDGMRITIPKVQLRAQKSKIAENGTVTHYPADDGEGLDAACDIGTTTVVCHLIDGKTGEKLATVSEPSAQRSFGADVLSRIQAAEAGKLDIKRTDYFSDRTDASDTAEKTGRGEQIQRLAVVGNTVMCHLFAGISPVSIGVTPFMPQEFFGKEYTGEQLGLTDCRSVYIAPAVAGFVGGDITSDLLAVMQKNPKEKVLLLDIGTNGEMAVGNEDQIYCCATAVGSAFEGAEMAMGMPAAAGAISHVWLDQRRIRVQVIGDEEACGICGSGLIDALAVILEMGLLDHTGLLKQKQSVSVAYRKYLGEYAGQPCVWLAHKVCVTQEDIRGLQLAKAAFAAGMRILLQDSHTSYEQLDHVILAGGFGSYLKKESAAAIGLIPKELLPITDSVGNAAGEGAVSAAISKKAREQLSIIQKSMHYIELSTHPDFSQEYMNQMDFDGSER